MTEQAFICPVCGKAFDTLTEVQDHQHREHEEVGELLFPCPVCGLEFPTRAMLVKHLPLHDVALIGTKQIKP